MCYIVKPKQEMSFKCSTYKKAKRIEAIFIGLKKNYSLTYPNGDVKHVSFETVKSKQIKELKKQMSYLQADTKFSPQCKTELMAYYEYKLKQLSL